MGPKKWNFLQDEPCAQVIRYVGDRLPSFLPNGRMVGCSARDEYEYLVAEATISRKVECIITTWCSTSTARLCVYRGGVLAEQSNFFFNESCSETWAPRPITYCVTLRRKHRVVEAVQPGDRLLVFLKWNWLLPLAISTSEANVCVVYNGDGHLLLEVNSELLSEDASRDLEKQFGELVLKDAKSRRKSRRK